MAKNERDGGTADPGPETQRVPVVPAYQEGSVQSVGGGPSGVDRSDRSGDGALAPLPEKGTGPEPARDAFISSEVSDKTAIPGKDPRTRS